MSKRRGGSLPRVMPAKKSGGLDIRMMMPGLPIVAIPTTAGTGSEVTRNSVLSGDGVKASLRSPLMLPRLAVVDPDLLLGKAYGAIGPIRIPLNYFVLSRWRKHEFRG